MKKKRLLVLLVLALFAVGAAGVFTHHVFASNVNTSGIQTQAQTQVCAQDQSTDSETQATNDTDNVDVQCGDQNEADNSVGESNTGDSQDAAPTGTPAITESAAQSVAEAYLNQGTATKVQLDDENNQLVYSVEIGSTDVKVDAMSGLVLGTD